MPSRENRGLQTALIFFVMTTVVLAITTYVYFRQRQDRTVQLSAATEAEREATRAYEVENARFQMLQHMLGNKVMSEAELTALRRTLPPNGTMKDIEEVFRVDVETYGEGLLAPDLNYRGMLRNLESALRDRSQWLTAASEREVDLIAARDLAREDEQKRAAAIERAYEEAVADLAREREQFNEDRARLKAEKNKLAIELATAKEAMANQSAAHELEIRELQGRLTQLTLRHQTAVDEIRELKGPVFKEKPDGEIVWADASTGMVRINLGSADGLQRQVTFRVIDQAATSVGEAKIKGRIEVTGIKEDHLSDARILDDELTDPILRGDKIYSTAWQKGHQLHFALAGVIDIDGNGTGDRDKLKAIIATNSGVVDAELLDDGRVEGKMTFETQYLIKGDSPTEESSEAFRNGFTNLMDQASRLGVQVMTLEGFLQRIGYPR
jgi:hypothetical protein